MRVLGLSAFHHDSAAVLVIDGRPIFGARESWMTRRRSDPGFPRRSAREVLRNVGLRAEELDAVVLARKPLLEFERVLVLGLRAWPGAARPFAREMFTWLGDRLWARNRVVSELGVAPQKVRFAGFHRALAAAAFLGSPFEEAAILTLDEGGEWCSATLARGGEGGIECLAELSLPHSLPHFAAAVARLLHLDEPAEDGRFEALALQGEPRHLELLASYLPEAPGGAHTLAAGALLPGPEGAPLGSPELGLRLEGCAAADVAASLQALLEERTLSMVRELWARTGLPALCFAGSASANARVTARIAEQSPFSALHLAPAADESQAALGAALLLGAQGGELPRAASELYLGPPPLLRGADEGAKRRDEGTPSSLAELAPLLERGATIARVQGRRELGRAGLGRRSALREARASDAAARLFAALARDDAARLATLLLPAERAEQELECPPAALPALRSGRIALRPRPELALRVPSAVARDGRVLAQTVDVRDDPELHALLLALGARTGSPFLLRAELAPRGAAPVCGEADAIDVLRRTRLDALFLEGRLYEAP